MTTITDRAGETPPTWDSLTAARRAHLEACRAALARLETLKPAAWYARQYERAARQESEAHDDPQRD